MYVVGDILRVIYYVETTTHPMNPTSTTATGPAATTLILDILQRHHDIMMVVVVAVVVAERLRCKGWRESTSLETHPPSDLIEPLIHP